ncbi:cellulose-binding protein [Streptomyces sp. NPDC005407]|uniref:cellulose-binding protein n=1 Tax=Streptomyces sp. NPDC005407 TaxID=3155340 RepID=UPI0033A516A8
MSAASVSPHGFVAVRGRGYPLKETDAYVTSLSQDRDDAWERAARLTVLAREMEAEAAGLRERVAALAPPTYETLGRRAESLLALAVEASEELRATSQDEAQAVIEASDAAARRTRDAAREHADSARADAEARAQQTLLAAQATADEIRIEARRDVKERRGEAVAAWKDMRLRTESALADLETEQAGRWEAVERELADCSAQLDARHAELTADAEAGLSEAKCILAESEEYTRHGQEDAEARAAELLAEARACAERIARETERLLREHEESREEMEAHMAHISNSLAALTGRAAAEG